MRPAAEPARQGTRAPAEVDPVVSVLVDVPLAHLDRPFDYLVPAADDEVTRPGVRVRVRFAGRLVDGVVLARGPRSEHEGRLALLERVVSAEPVLDPEGSGLLRAVADHWGGVAADVLRLAVPPRHARVEAEPPAEPAPPPAAPDPAGWARYRADTFLTALAAGRRPRAVWSALPGEDWPIRFAEAAAAAAAGGHGALLLVPDRTDLDRLNAALTAQVGAAGFVTLAADLGPAPRYRGWLRARRGTVRIVAGTRAAAYAPVADLGLVAIWDDGDDLYDEPRAPYANARDVLVLRASRSGAAALLGGWGRSVAAAHLVERRWARELVAPAAVLRAAAPAVRAAGDDAALARDEAARTARLPSLAWETAGGALRAGHPVLVQVPRRGYLPLLACRRCRTPARCRHCSGPLGQPAADRGTLACRWCGRPASDWVCPVCGDRGLRAAAVGARRTAEELGRAFPGVRVRTSGRDGVLATVGGGPALVVATPGAEPVADGGYGAALLLDGRSLLARPDLRAAEEAARRWFNAAALVRPGGAVVLTADPGVPAVQALIRWAPGWLAERELTERGELGFPPAYRFAAVVGPPDGVADLLAAARLPVGTDRLGPVAAPATSQGVTQERLLLRAPGEQGGELARALHAAQAVRSARKAPEPVRVQLDPGELV